MKHLTRELLELAEGSLPEAERARVERHLSHCASCREKAREIADGVELVRELAPRRLPPTRAETIRRALEEAPSGPEHRGRRLPAARAWAAAAAAVVIGLALLWTARSREPHVALRKATGPPTRFEQVARELHARLRDPDAPLEFRSESGREVRRWVKEHTDLSASLADRRPPEDIERYRLRGASSVKLGDYSAAAVTFLVDSRPVTLLLTKQENVPDAPRWNFLGKRVRYRVEREGETLKLLSWTNSGNAYTLVSELPGLGQRACLVCHTDPARRRLIEGLAPESLEHRDALAPLRPR